MISLTLSSLKAKGFKSSPAFKALHFPFTGFSLFPQRQRSFIQVVPLIIEQLACVVQDFGVAETGVQVI